MIRLDYKHIIKERKKKGILNNRNNKNLHRHSMKQLMKQADSRSFRMFFHLYCLRNSRKS